MKSPQSWNYDSEVWWFRTATDHCLLALRSGPLHRPQLGVKKVVFVQPSAFSFVLLCGAPFS